MRKSLVKLLLIPAAVLALSGLKVNIDGTGDTPRISLSVNKADAFVRRLIRGAKRLGKRIKRGLRRVGDKIKKGARRIVNKIKKGARRIVNNIKKGIKKIGSWIKDKIYQGIRKQLKKIYAGLTKAARKVSNTIKKLKPRNALVVCIENLNDKKHPFIDDLLETFSAIQMNLYALRYKKKSIIKDCTSTKLQNAVASYKDYNTDIAILAHGSTTHFALNNGSFRKSNITALGKLNKKIRAVFQLNCWGSYLRDAWIAAGAKAVMGAKKINMRVTAYNNFFGAWVLGKKFKDAVKSCNKAKGLLQIILKAAEWFAKRYGKNKGKVDSTFIYSGNGNLRF